MPTKIHGGFEPIYNYSHSNLYDADTGSDQLGILLMRNLQPTDHFFQKEVKSNQTRYDCDELLICLKGRIYLFWGGHNLRLPIETQ